MFYVVTRLVNVYSFLFNFKVCFVAKNCVVTEQICYKKIEILVFVVN